MQPDSSQLPLLEGDPTLSQELVRYPAAQTTQLQFKLNAEPFNDPKVREAFAYAFDRETYATAISNGSVLPTLTWIPEGLPGSIETDQFAFNPDAARQALAESSYVGAEGLPEITFTYANDDPAAQPRVEWIAGQYRDILGVNITLEPLEARAITALKKDNATYPQMSLGGWIQDYPDPQNWLSVYWQSNATFAQRVQYQNEEFDRLVREADTTVDDPQRRLELYEQAHQILIDEQAGINLYNPAAIFLVKPTVTGYEESPSDVEWPGLFGSNRTITKSAE
jgi:oligopeptide transport system substrate-binding protein